MDPATSSLTRVRGRAHWLRRAAGYSIGALSLLWFLHQLRPHDLLSDLSATRWEWVTVAIGCDILSYVCQGWRWQILLRGTAPISTLKATQAIYAGLFTNELLPMRVGEVVRTWLVAQWLRAGMTPMAVTYAEGPHLRA